MCVCSAQLCPTLCNRMNCRPPGSSVYGILQARTPEWVAIFFSRGSFWLRIKYASLLLLLGAGRVLHHYCHLGSPYPVDIDKSSFKENYSAFIFSNYNECCDTCFLNLDLVETDSETESCMREFYWEERICSGEKKEKQQFCSGKPGRCLLNATNQSWSRKQRVVRIPGTLERM